MHGTFPSAEPRQHPMHVGGLHVYEPPAGAGPEFVRELYDKLLTKTDADPTFRKHPREVMGGLSQLTWAIDPDLDLEYHLRHSALPHPGQVRQLLELVSRLHATLLDRHRPLWEMHLVEGLDDGRFAVYAKTHHALMDGVSQILSLRRALTTDPDDHDPRAYWAPHEPAPKKSLLDIVKKGAESLAALGPGTFNLARKGILQQKLTSPFEAPRTMFNVPIGGARRFAAQSWPFERFRAVKKAAGVTINDVVLAVCGGALRAYLIEQDALPAKPLIAMVPVSLREGESTGGNEVGSLLANLGTDLTDPAERLRVVHTSMKDNKEVFKSLPEVQQMALSAYNSMPMMLELIPVLKTAARPPFNIVISNVPGDRNRLYWGGAELVGNYPMSIVLDGQALNITLTNTADRIDFGVVGCRSSVPHLQRLLVHLEDSLSDLERAVGQTTS
ncbi:MAG: wax ester/triacylglycerol synthase family O-acyltransferase [Mycobacterium sp.]|nr:wax ester/triacylglycerol synthase family O-acyltransferase [Mycobacterium sp.]